MTGLVDSRVNLVGRTPGEIASLLEEYVDRSYRARQVAQWVVDRNASGFTEMTNLTKELRAELGRHFRIVDPQILEESASGDGSVKWLFELSDGVTIEGVSMPENGKLTMCLSTQAGCAVGCTFCVTGALGAGRNLRPDEIVGQYRVMLRQLDEPVDRVMIELFQYRLESPNVLFQVPAIGPGVSQSAACGNEHSVFIFLNPCF